MSLGKMLVALPHEIERTIWENGTKRTMLKSEWSDYSRVLEDGHPLKPKNKRRSQMKIAKVKIFTSKTSYKDLEREVNEFISNLDNVKTIEYQDT